METAQHRIGLSQRLLGAAALAVLLTSAGHSAPEARLALPAASGRVTYRINSPLLTGTAIFAWTEEGRRFRQDLKQFIKTGKGGSVRQDLWAISDGTNLFSYQPMMGKQVMRSEVVVGEPNTPAEAALLAASSESRKRVGNVVVGEPNTPAEAALLAASSESRKRVGTATILGKPCEIFLVNGSRLWVWNKLPLKVETYTGQGKAKRKVTAEAVKLELTVKLPASLFQVPSGYQVRDLQMPGSRRIR
jgi:hypothetical protein